MKRWWLLRLLSRHYKAKIKPFVFCSVLLLISFQSEAEWFKYQQDIMGTRIAVELFSQDKDQADYCSQRVFKEMKRIDALMSPFIEQSELAKINRLASLKPLKIGDELFSLIARSMEFSKISEGAFDISFASVGYLYNYRENKHPSKKQISQRLSGINYKNIKLNKKLQSIFFSNKNTRIDLGGIAKGYAVDNGIQRLKSCGIENALVSAGGDSRILGDKNGRPWMMGVRHPRDKNKVAVTIPLSNTAISTSGDYERYFLEDGRRYHHIIKPSTGASVDQTWSVSVLADSALTSDALSTTLFVLGTEKALKLVDSLNNVDAIIIDAHGKMFYSKGLMPPVAH